MSDSPYPLTVFYDGACRMCVKQMAAFRKRDAKQRLIFRDISRPDFDAKRFGLQGAPLQRYIHAKDQKGEVARGVDAFLWLWRATDRSLLASLAGLPLMRELGKAAYHIISRVRYQLSGTQEGVCDLHCAKEV
ncbi:MAG: DUF393 domain-containing protein [Patescibacteria group bacterium]